MVRRVRARDVRPTLKEMGFEQGVAHILEVILERQNAQANEMRECAQALDQMTNIIQQFTQVQYNIKNAVEAINKERGEDKYDLGDNTQGL